MKYLTLFWLVLLLNLTVILLNAYAYVVTFGWLAFIATNVLLLTSWLAIMFTFRMTYVRNSVSPIES